MGNSGLVNYVPWFYYWYQVACRFNAHFWEYPGLPAPAPTNYLGSIYAQIMVGCEWAEAEAKKVNADVQISTARGMF